MSSTGTAKLFKHGRSQAVRLPKEFRLPGTEVRVRRIGRGVLLEPIDGPFDVDAWFAKLDEYLDALHARWSAAAPMPPHVGSSTDGLPRYERGDCSAQRSSFAGPSSYPRDDRTWSYTRDISHRVVRAAVSGGEERPPQRNVQRIADFPAGRSSFRLFQPGDAEEAGDIRAALERTGTRIGPYDVLIAAQARCSDAVLVTANES